MFRRVGLVHFFQRSRGLRNSERCVRRGARGARNRRNLAISHWGSPPVSFRRTFDAFTFTPNLSMSFTFQMLLVVHILFSVHIFEAFPLLCSLLVYTFTTVQPMQAPLALHCRGWLTSQDANNVQVRGFAPMSRKVSLSQFENH